MNNWQPILQGSTLNFGWPKKPDYSFTALDTLAPLTVNEMASASRDMVILFAYDESLGKFSMGALQSLQPGLNVYVSSEGRWLGKHVPLFYQGAPFGLVKADEEQVAMYVDQGSPLVHTPPQPGDAELYAAEDDSEFSEDFYRLLDLHRGLQEYKDKTQALVDQCSSLNLIEPWALELDIFKTGEPLKIEGLFQITRERIKALDDASLGELNRSGALAMIFAHQQSFSRFRELAAFYTQSDQVKVEMAHRQLAAKKAEINLDDELSLDEEDLFKF